MTQTYHDWAVAHQPRPEELARLRAQVNDFGYRPLVSLVMPTYNTPAEFLCEAIDSVQAQVYPNWELCIADDCSPEAHVRQILEEYAARDPRIKVVFRDKNGHISHSSNSALALATGEYVGLLDHDDLLTPHALYEVVRLLNQYPQADMIYSDEDKIDQYGRFGEPACKAAWCPDAMLSRMYTCHFGVYRREILKFIGGFRAGYEGSQDYDLVLRFTERTRRVYHIPQVLYHWRIHSGSAAGSTEAKPYAYKAAMMALRDAVNRRGQTGWVISIQERPGHYRIRYEVKPGQTASLVITVREGEAAKLDRLLGSLAAQPAELLYEVWVLAVGSSPTDKTSGRQDAYPTEEGVDGEVKAVYERYAGSEFGHKLRWIEGANGWPGQGAAGESWAALANQVVRQANGTFVLFLESDLEPHSGDWLSALAEQVQRMEIGAAGAMLLADTNEIYHVGMALNLGGKLADCLYRGATGRDVSYADSVYVDLQNNCTAVASACLMVRRDRFLAVGGFDERLWPPYAEVDLGLKLRSRGWHNIYLPHVKFFHRQPDAWQRLVSVAAWAELEQANQALLWRKWGEQLHRDLCYSPLLAGSGQLTGATLDEYYALQDRFIGADRPLVSVCVPTYNGAEFLAAALASVAEQTYQNLEVLIWDEGSSDRTLEIAQEFQRQHPRLRCRIDRHVRLGMAGNWTAVARAARGKYVKFLHQDDRLAPDCIAALVALAEQDPEIGLVFAPRQLELTPAAAADAACQKNARDSAELHRGWSRLAPIQDGRALLGDPALLSEPINKIGEPSAVLLRRSLFGLPKSEDVTGEPDTNFGLRTMAATSASSGAEIGGFAGHLKQLLDLEFWWRVLAAGYRVGFVDRPLSVRRIHPAQGTQQNAAELVADAARFYATVAEGDIFAHLAPTVQGMVLAQRDRLAGALGLDAAAMTRPQAATPGEPSVRSGLAPIPAIAPVAPGGPLWSVVIPSYNPGTHFTELLRSVLDQAPGPEEMEILVVDDASTEGDPASLVAQLGQGRIRFERQAENLGLLGNWNDAIARSRGQWVHLLHQDDRLLPGFYAQLGRAIAAQPGLGAVICRHHHIDEAGRVLWTSEAEAEQPGVVADWLDRLALRQRMQFVATVVRRAVYEELGGFWPEAATAADWEMWLRIAAKYPVWFEPQVLAEFRRHRQSTTSRLIQTGQNIADTRRVIRLAKAYLPDDRADSLTAQALERYAFYALDQARVCLHQGEEAAAVAQIREALLCSDQPTVRSQVAEIFLAGSEVESEAESQASRQVGDAASQSAPPEPRQASLARLFGARASVAEQDRASVDRAAAPVRASTQPPRGPNWVRAIEPLVSIALIFQNLANEIERGLERYQARPNDPGAIEAVRYLRYQLALQWWELPLDRVQEAWDSRLGLVHRALMASNLRYEERLDWEGAIVARGLAELGDEGPTSPQRARAFIVLMLFCRAYELPLSYDELILPTWFTWWYALYCLEAPLYFQAVGEADRFRNHLLAWTDQVYNTIIEHPGTNIVKALLKSTTYHGVYTPLYFCAATEPRVYQQRAQIIETTLVAEGRQTTWQPGARPADRRRIRVGVLKDHFNPQTETFSTIPYFEHLDRSRFEVFLYAVRTNDHPLERYCADLCERSVALPQDLAQQVEVIRGDNLDVLLIGTNVTMVTNSITLLASHRLARVQVINNSAPVTTGMRHVDAYLSGSLSELDDRAAAQAFYSEKLVCFEGPAHCFNYEAWPQAATLRPRRADWGIEAGAVVFFSGANFNKLVPELRHTWAKILAALPGSYLILYPFNPNWGQNYPARPFIANFQALLESYGVDRRRLVVMEPLPTSADIRECLKLGDLYLDSFPFAGVNSTVDPLLVGLPPVVFEGDCFRSRMAAALLRSLSLPELVARTEAEYIELAIALARDGARRGELGDRIRAAMGANPVFLDGRRYGQQTGEALGALLADWQGRFDSGLINQAH